MSETIFVDVLPKAVQAAIKLKPAQTYAKAVTVLSPAFDDPLGTAWLVPNPASASLGALVIGLDRSIDTSGLTGQVYNLAGERVASLAPDMTGKLVWSFNGRASAGIYLIQLQMVDAGGKVRMRVLKAALLP